MHIINKIKYLLRKKVKIVNKDTIHSNHCIYLNFKIIIIYLIIIINLVSCDKLVTNNQEVVARVGTEYLYRNELEKIKNIYNNESDSILKIRNFIDSWARNKLLLQKAQVNLPDDDIDNLLQLVEQYRFDLFGNAYTQVLANKSIDTIISENEIDNFLNENKEIFKLKAPLYKVRYIHLPSDNVDQDEIQFSFQRFNKDDQLFLDSLSFQYIKYILSDSIWINRNTLKFQVRFLNQNNFDKYVKKSKFFKIEDRLGVYLFFVKELMEKGDIAPKEVSSATIKNILLNQRKLKFTKQFEKDILQDAIESKTYEIY